MNLWQRPIEQITFEDINSFCIAGWEESVRLDYKAEWPDDLAKTIAAMANTVGGMIVIGVDADKKTNKPIWPPMEPVPPRKGFPRSAGLSERVYQVARDVIFPPIMPEVSPVLENKKLPGQAILVIRIPESKDAPHATEKKKTVYIYERTGNQGYAHSLADIEYIERLFSRRQRIEADRERMIDGAINRAKSKIGNSVCSYRWASVIPHYPWKPICTPAACHEYHAVEWTMNKVIPYCPQFHHQRVPNGSFGTYYGRNEDGSQFPVGCTSISDRGHVFALTIALEQTSNQVKDFTIYYAHTQELLINLIKGAINFYKIVNLERPIYLQISLGILNAKNLKLEDGSQRRRIQSIPSLFPDDFFRSDSTVLHFDEDPKELAKPILEELRFGFDITV